MTDRDDEEQQPTPVDGVRILGAREAGARDQDQPDRPEVAPRPGEPTPGEATPGGEAIPGEAIPGEARPGEATPEEAPTHDEVAPAEVPSGEVPPLLHWTEPPTGAVPAIFADDSDVPDDEDLDAWATISGAQPRFRAEGADWAEADYGEELSGEHERLGALSEEEPVDEEAAFAEELAARRRPMPRGRPPRTVTAPARPGAARRREPEGEAAPPGPAAVRDLPTAILTAAVIVVVALICFKQGTTWTAVLATVVIAVATVELSNTLHQRGFRPATLLALLGALTLPLAAKHYGVGAYPVFFALIVVFAMLWFLWGVTPGRPLLGVATTVLVFAYVAGLGAFSGLLLRSRDGVGLILGVAICTIAYDVFGFFVGSQFGRSRIAPRVSPNKTLEGTIAGMAASVAFGVLVVGAIGPWTRGYGALLGVVVAAGAFLGDLSESMIKRDLGVKDFGSLLPGHGGVLDRFDALLFCLPITYYLALHLKIL